MSITVADLRANLSVDTGKYEKALKDAGSDADRLADDIKGATKAIGASFDRAEGDARRFGGAMDSAAGAADASESKFMGAADLLDGLGGAFGLPTEGATNLFRAFGDLSGGFAILGPVVGGFGGKLKTMGATALSSAGQVVASFASMAKEAVKSVATAVAQIAVQIGRWIVMGVTALAAAAQVALAWLISLGPIALVVAAVVGAVALIIANWDRVKDAAKAVFEWVRDRFNDVVGFLSGVPGRIGAVLSGIWDNFKQGVTIAKNWVVDRFNDVVGFVGGLPGRIASVASGMFDGIKNAFKAALNWIIDKWNGLQFTLPSIDTHIPGVGKIGGFTLGTPDLPRFHSGGVVPGPRGADVPIMAQAGETIVPAGGGGGGSVINVNVSVPPGGDPDAHARAIVEQLEAYQRRSGRVWATA